MGTLAGMQNLAQQLLFDLQVAFNLPERSRQLKNMKRLKPSIVIVQIIVAAILLMRVTSIPAQGAQRDDSLPPGENMEMVEWIQIPMADPFH